LINRFFRNEQEAQFNAFIFNIMDPNYYLLNYCSVIEKKNVRIRREKPPFVQTTCLLIDSVAKERCHTSTTEHNERHATQTQSCVTDEKFRVKYKIQNGQMITSTIETFGYNFPRLIQVDGSIFKVVLHSRNYRIKPCFVLVNRIL
jgi:hypothetical protein